MNLVVQPLSDMMPMIFSSIKCYFCFNNLLLLLEQEHKTISDEERSKRDEERVTSEKMQEEIMKDYLSNDKKNVETNYR